MQSDHHSRIIGMGLLLGKFSFQALESVRTSLAKEPEDLDLQAVIQELLRRRELDEESLQRLEGQVADLERMLVSPSKPEPDNSTLEVLNPATVNLHTEAHRNWQKTGLQNTPPTGIWKTLPRGPARDEEGHALRSAITIPSWNQYQTLQFIGEGGMGRIFKAFDPSLNRSVALKFLRQTNRDSVGDLIREARNQAQVDHPNICKVYEVKEWHGQIYVAMQFINGRTLDKVAPSMSMDQKLELMETVADAVHAAHRHGLVHRDLKPANIMVEVSLEGALTPFILDFGLAQEVADLEESMQGSIVGTAHYMAPEQARGDIASIERRTDVYALGVTLYELFTGAPPFHDVPGMGCLQHICDADIPPVRTLRPEVPLDLQTIIMKCLEKEIPRRYDSARALAEDLRRLREGDPIHARAATLGYRMGKFARKNRVLVSLGAASIATIFLFAGLGCQARLTAASQARWAQHFGQEAERIEALLRYARLHPVHDLSPELQAVQDRIRAMEAEVARAGGRALGPGSYALGRAYLALGDAERASTFLDRAWDAGYRAQDAAYARGRALGQRYAAALRKARLIVDPQLRNFRLKELENTLRTPAMELLRQGRGSLLEPTSFQEGLLALYDGRHAEALAMARDAARRAPWFYEALILEAEVHLEQARRAVNLEAQLVHLQQAGQVLGSASRVAPSDDKLWDLLSRRWWDEITLLRSAGRDSRTAYEALVQACEPWRQILPTDAGPDARLAWGTLERARVAAPNQRASLVQQAVDQAQRVYHRHPRNEEALAVLASSLVTQAYTELQEGRDPRPILDRALGMLPRDALGGDSSAYALFPTFAEAMWARIEYEKSRGLDPTATAQGAAQSIRSLVERFPTVPDFEGFLGGILVELADHQSNHGEDPAKVTQEARQHLERAMTLAPHRFEFPYSLGNAHLALAQYRLMMGQPLTADLDAAETAYQKSLNLNRTNTGPRYGLGEVGLLRSQALRRAGLNPMAALAKAEEVMADPKVEAEQNWRTALFKAQASLLRAQVHPNPTEALALLAKAEGSVSQALEGSGRMPMALYVKAQILVEWAARKPSSAALLKEQALAVLREAMRLNPKFEPTRLMAASLEGRQETKSTRRP